MRARDTLGGLRPWPIDMSSNKDAGRSQSETPTPCECEQAQRYIFIKQGFYCGRAVSQLMHAPRHLISFSLAQGAREKTPHTFNLIFIFVISAHGNARFKPSVLLRSICRCRLDSNLLIEGGEGDISYFIAGSPQGAQRNAFVGITDSSLCSYRSSC